MLSHGNGIISMELSNTDTLLGAEHLLLSHIRVMHSHGLLVCCVLVVENILECRVEVDGECF